MTASGLDLSHVKSSVRPQDDLFGYVNGQWLDTFEIPPDRGADGAFRELRDQSEEQVRQIIEDLAQAQPDGQGGPAAHEAQLIAALYRSFMDEAAVEAKGATPLLEDLAVLQSSPAGGAQGLAWALGRLERSGAGGLFASWVDTDPAQPDRYVVNFGQAGLGLPDEAYYREDQYQAIRDQYVSHITAMLKLVGEKLAGPAAAGGLTLPVPAADAAAAAARIFAFETRLAAAHWDVVKDRDDTLTHNPMSLAQVKDLAPDFPWDAWAQGVGAKPGTLDNLVVREPDYFVALGREWASAWERVVPEWAWWHLLHGRAAYLSADIVDENFAFYGRVLQGTERLRDRWKRGVGFVEGCVGEAVGRIYTERHFPPAYKARMLVLVGHLIEAYRQSITELTWLGEATKAKALEKLDQFTPKIGYPDRWRDYAALTADPSDLVGNLRAVSAFETDRELNKIGGPVDRDEWFMTPQTVNAYYNPGMNEIVFPAAILQPPFFWMEADDAANYGGIGAVIGHEIGHGFDDQGSKYDGEGRLADWWTPADRAAFEERTKALIDQYSGFKLHLPDGDLAVNGALTIGENIGDLGGLAIAWRAYLISLAEAGVTEPPVLGGMTAAQRFFFGWAQCWRAKTRPQEAALRLSVDPHSPDEFRCNGVVRNLDLFYEAYGVTPADALWLAADQRVTIW
ncbi:MAG: peptidase M13 [Bifidobacteriaceae bacterium]|nr:peptidase M13 [Bifidobacteriaceae bacterium]